MPSELLVLFDLDGTLLLDDAYAHGRAMVQGMRAVYGVELPDEIVMQIDPWGKTDLRIAREALRTAGFDDRKIDEGLGAWKRIASDAFEHEVVQSSDAWQARPGLEDGLRRIAGEGMRLALLTGNLRAIALSKIEYLGLSNYLDAAASAFGDDAEQRAALVPLARRRAGSAGRPWPRELTAVIGDTPGDIAAARADSVACAIFSSTRFQAQYLSGAGAVVSSFDELIHALKRWRASEPGPGAR